MPVGGTWRPPRARNYWTAQSAGCEPGPDTAQPGRLQDEQRGRGRGRGFGGTPQPFAGSVKCEGERAPVPQCAGVARPSAGAQAARAGRRSGIMTNTFGPE